jgi:hypothetical protein
LQQPPPGVEFEIAKVHNFNFHFRTFFFLISNALSGIQANKI